MVYKWFFKPADFPERILVGEYSKWEEFEEEFRNKLVGQYEFNDLNIFLGRDMANNILSAVKQYGNGLCVEDPNTGVEYSFEVLHQ